VGERLVVAVFLRLDEAGEVVRIARGGLAVRFDKTYALKPAEP